MQKLTDAKEELERLYGIKVLPVQADVSAGADNKAVVDNVVKQAIDTFGRIDVLINNAQASASELHWQIIRRNSSIWQCIQDCMQYFIICRHAIHT